jgi:hypothetical protein
VLDARAKVPRDWRPGNADERPEPPPEVQALAVAYERLRTAEEAVRPELDAAWERNRKAVQDAKARVRDARRAQGRIEVEAGNAARRRNPVRPVLNQAEVEQVAEAAAATQAALADLEAARRRFKDGVTVEQLEAAE